MERSFARAYESGGMQPCVCRSHDIELVPDVWLTRSYPASTAALVL